MLVLWDISSSVRTNFHFESLQSSVSLCFASVDPLAHTLAVLLAKASLIMTENDDTKATKKKEKKKKLEFSAWTKWEREHSTNTYSLTWEHFIYSFSHFLYSLFQVSRIRDTICCRWQKLLRAIQHNQHNGRNKIGIFCFILFFLFLYRMKREFFLFRNFFVEKFIWIKRWQIGRGF